MICCNYSKYHLSVTINCRVKIIKIFFLEKCVLKLALNDLLDSYSGKIGFWIIVYQQIIPIYMHSN